MVKRLINFLEKEISGLHEAAYLLGVFAILSQVLALVRDRLLVHTFGTGTTLDLYYAAFRIPDFLFVLVASFFSASIIIPFLSVKAKESVVSGREFLSVIFSFFLMAMIGASVITFILAPYFVPYIFPGFSDEPLRGQIILMTRILLLSPIFLGLSNLLASVTQLHNRFFIYGISPLLYNLGIIFGVVVLAPQIGVAGLVWGVAIGATLHFAVQVPFVVKSGFAPSLVWSMKRFREVRGVMLVAFPRTLALSAQELSRFFLVFLASLMGVGSISVFSLSYNLQSVPLSIIGVSYSLAAFPTLAGLFVSGEKTRFVDLVRTTSRYIIFFSLPLIALFIVLRAHIVRVILGSGSFSWDDTRLTAAALALFVISLAAQGLVLIFTRARYAAGNTRASFYINTISVIITIVAAFGLTTFFTHSIGFQNFIEMVFRVSGIPGTKVLMLPLAFSIGSIFSVFVHILTFGRAYDGGKDVNYKYQARVATSDERVEKCGIVASIGLITLQMAFIALFMGLTTYLTLNATDQFFDLNTFWGILTHGLIAGLVGIFTGIILLTLTRSQELHEVFVSLRHRFWNTPVIGPDSTS